MKRQTLILMTLFTVLLLTLAACSGQQAAPSAEATEAPTEEADAPSDEDSEAQAAEPTEEAAEEADSEEAMADSEESSESGDAATEGMRSFVVQPDESTAAYLVDEEFLGGALDKLGIAAGAVDVVGSTQEVAGEFEIDVANGAIGANEFTVQIDTLSSDQNRRDNWVRDQAPAFGRFPIATFVASGVENAPTDYSDGEEVTFQLVGDLTVRDTTVPVTFDVTATLDGDSIIGTAIADLLMSDFGINPPDFANTLVVQDAFQVQMDLVAVEE